MEQTNVTIASAKIVVGLTVSSRTVAGFGKLIKSPRFDAQSQRKRFAFKLWAAEAMSCLF